MKRIMFSGNELVRFGYPEGKAIDWLMSRSKTKQSIIATMIWQALEQNEITLIGGLDEETTRYKDIRKVMHYHQDLVEIVGEFSPRIVRMCGDDSPAED